ncbi:MAG: hypothetical protein R2881_09805 [Eubacteriales bacterium]
MIKNSSSIDGEQSGHIIQLTITTGDGLMSAITTARRCRRDEQTPEQARRAHSAVSAGACQR